jgi:hypothetical protein
VFTGLVRVILSYVWCEFVYIIYPCNVTFGTKKYRKIEACEVPLASVSDHSCDQSVG